MKIKNLILAVLVAAPGFAQMGGGMGGFGGPAVMGSGVGSNTGRRGGADLGVSVLAGVMATVDSGLTGLSLDSNGNINSSTGKGVDGFVGVFGSKRLRRGSFGINYNGHYRQYSGLGNFNGTDQALALFASRQLTKRSTISTFISATTTNRPFGFNIAGAGLDPLAGTLFSPTGELFDNRIYMTSGNVEYTIQKSARLSFHTSGNGFLVRRTGNILFGVNGTNLSSGASYRLSRRQTISAGYQFLMYNFTRNFGDTYGHGAYAGYSVQVGRRMQVALQGGLFRLESLGLRTANIDPVIAALVGFSTVSEVFYSKTLLPTAMASVNYKVSRFHDLSVNGGVMPAPGNGVINTSRNSSIGGSYTYSGIREVGLSLNGNYIRMGSLIAGNQIFESLMFGGNISKKITGQIFATAGVGNRRFLGSSTNTFVRNSYFVTAGLTWSPKEVPISIR
jgi:hypothetical protein